MREWGGVICKGRGRWLRVRSEEWGRPGRAGESQGPSSTTVAGTPLAVIHPWQNHSSMTADVTTVLSHVTTVEAAA